jgi:hypothetical protein
MSTRVEGAGPPVILITAKATLAARSGVEMVNKAVPHDPAYTGTGDRGAAVTSMRATAVPGTDLGAWLRRQREGRFWDRPEMARQLIRAAQARGDMTMPGAYDLIHNINRWERGTTGISARYKLYYCLALGIAPDDFGRDRHHPTRKDAAMAAATALVRSAVTAHDAPRTDGTDADLAAARRLLEHMRGTLECLAADVIDFQNALDGPPGVLTELADKVLERDWDS